MIVENDSSICHAIKRYMQDENTDIYCAASAVEAIGRFMKEDYSLVIIDIHCMEEINMLYIMREVKKTPILVLAVPLESNEKIALFRAGADAYMEMPLDLGLCKAQANALIELYLQSDLNSARHMPLVFGTELLINPQYRKVLVSGKALSLTRKEFDLLHYLASHPGQVFSKEQLYRQIWQDDSILGGDDTVKTHIKTLRKKMGDMGKKCIQTIWGIGYKFTPSF